jgi:hypothetical protein
VLNKNAATHSVKVMLARAGARAPAGAVRAASLASGYFAVGRWLSENGFDTSTAVRGREGVFRAIADNVADLQVLYLEFGVFEGASLRYWSNALRHPESELHGFDSFEGLPETFDAHSYPKGRFDLGGNTPVIDEPRIQYHVGWFDQTLPTFDIPAHDQLVVTLDADLYSSTKLALDHLAPAIKPGTILYFDELSRVDHEPAAFLDFMSTYDRRFKVLAIEDTFNTGAFICTA